MASKAWNGKTTAIVGLVCTILITVLSSWVTAQVTLATTRTRMDYTERDLMEIKSEVRELNHKVNELTVQLKKG